MHSASKSDDVANYCFLKTWPADREQRARIIRCSPASSTARHIVVDANGLSTSRGDSNNIANIEIVCRRCNEEKGSLTREEFLRLRK